MLSVTAFIQNALNVDVHILANKCEHTKDCYSKFCDFKNTYVHSCSMK